MKTPKKVGEPTELCPRVFGKTAVNQKFVSPSGEEYGYLLWDYKNGEPPVIVIALTENLEVVAIKQYRHAADEVVTEVPGGCLIKNQTLEEAVREELLQETGFEAEKVDKLNRKPTWFEPSNLTVPYHAYLARGCKKVAEPKLDKTEHIELVVVDWFEWLRMIDGGEVCDSKTIVLTFLAMLKDMRLAYKFAQFCDVLPY